MVSRALEAATKLSKEKGIECRVINCHTVKPLDRETSIAAAAECGAVVTAEEHQVAGGLGSLFFGTAASGTPGTSGYRGPTGGLFSSGGIGGSALSGLGTGLQNFYNNIFGGSGSSVTGFGDDGFDLGGIGIGDTNTGGSGTGFGDDGFDLGGSGIGDTNTGGDYGGDYGYEP
jgi:hypothetical protein